MPELLQPEKLLALAIYRLARVCSFTVISDLFGVSKVLAIGKFSHVKREIVAHFIMNTFKCCKMKMNGKRN